MKRRKRRDEPDRPIFDSIRKPTAPPGHKIGEGSKPTEKAHPSRRKAKYKKTEDTEE